MQCIVNIFKTPENNTLRRVKVFYVLLLFDFIIILFLLKPIVRSTWHIQRTFR